MISTKDLVQVGRGFLMGGADIIPGVSGGTVALILGIYERLVTAISRFDVLLLQLLRGRKWRRAAEHIDLRFLVTLGIGIVLGIAGLAALMHYLLEHQLQPTFAVFFGLILGSSLLVARGVPDWTGLIGLSLLMGAAVASWLVGLPLLEQPPEGNAYVFVCGVLGISAMILPGISGAFILLILGKYSDMTGLLRDFLKLNVTPDDFATLAMFLAGCLLGLLSFSKLLRWLLVRYESFTMAVLCGFMLGSLRKIWPFKLDLTPHIEEFKRKQFENIVPEEWTFDVGLAVGLMVASTAVVLVLDWQTRAHERIAALEQRDELLSDHSSDREPTRKTPP